MRITTAPNVSLGCAGGHRRVTVSGINAAVNRKKAPNLKSQRGRQVTVQRPDSRRLVAARIRHQLAARSHHPVTQRLQRFLGFVGGFLHFLGA